MDTVKLGKTPVKMIAHRGVSGLETENTAAAFTAAAGRGYFGIEADVRRTKDGKFVILHDADTLRVSGERRVVSESTLDELRGLRLLSRDGKRDRGDLIIPTLEEYIGICKRGGKAAVLELKEPFDDGALDGIVSVIGREQYMSGVIFISFYMEPLITLRGKYPDQPIQFLAGGDMPRETLLSLLKEHRFDLDAYYAAVDREVVGLCHENGIKVNVWTVDLPGDAERLISYGVDFITTNILE